MTTTQIIDQNGGLKIQNHDMFFAADMIGMNKETHQTYSSLFPDCVSEGKVQTRTLVIVETIPNGQALYLASASSPQRH